MTLLDHYLLWQRKQLPGQTSQNPLIQAHRKVVTNTSGAAQDQAQALPSPSQGICRMWDSLGVTFSDLTGLSSVELVSTIGGVTQGLVYYGGATSLGTAALCPLINGIMSLPTLNTLQGIQAVMVDLNEVLTVKCQALKNGASMSISGRYYDFLCLP